MSAAAHVRARRRAHVLLAASGAATVGSWALFGRGSWPFLVSEAAFVAGCADWFAVAALFRAPLGVTFHTAIVPRAHAQVADGLARLLEDELLPPESIAVFLARTRPFAFLADALGPPPMRRERLVRLYEGIRAELPALGHPENVGRAQDLLRNLAARMPLAPTLARALRGSAESGWDSALAHGLIRRAREASAQPTFRARLIELLEARARGDTAAGEPRVWGRVGRFLRGVVVDVGEIVGAVDFDEAAQRIQDRVVEEIDRFHEPEHPLRREVEGLLAAMADRIEADDRVRAAVEAWKIEVLRAVDLAEPAAALLARLDGLVRDGEDAARLETRVVAAIEAWFEGLERDTAQREVLNASLRNALGSAIETLRPDIRDLVVESFQRNLPPERLVAFIEEKLGDVLQDLRVTGVLVGAAVGALLALVGTLIGAS